MEQSGRLCGGDQSHFSVIPPKKPIPGPSNRSPVVVLADLKVAGGDLLEGAGI